MASLHPELHPGHAHRLPPFPFRPIAEPNAPEHAEAPDLLVAHSSLAPGEFERTSVNVLEVIGLWGSTVLFATHLSPVRDFVIGEGSATEPVDFEMPAAALGQPTMKLIELRQGVPHALIAPGVGAVLSIAGGHHVDPAQLTAVALLSGTTVDVSFGQLRFRIASVASGALTPRAGLKSVEGSLFAAFGLSFGLAAALLAALAFWLPALDGADSDDLDQDRVLMMRQYLSAQAERNREQTASDDQTGQPGSERGAPAPAAAGRTGALGKPGLTAKNQRAAVAGDSAQTQLSRAQTIDAARSFGMIELLGTLSSTGGSNSPFARDSALGHNGVDSEGAMWGDAIGESGGNGLSLAGPSNGGGGRGTGVGLGSVGTCGTNCGWGHGERPGHAEHRQVAPRIRMAKDVGVSGRIPEEVVQRIVRQNYGRFRLCYEQGLRANPSLSGRVTTRFVIGRDGSVSNAGNGGSDLPDPGVVSCVVSAFYGLSFPTPENGIVRVTYPILFNPE